MNKKIEKDITRTLKNDTCIAQSLDQPEDRKRVKEEIIKMLSKYKITIKQTYAKNSNNRNNILHNRLSKRTNRRKKWRTKDIQNDNGQTIRRKIKNIERTRRTIK